jgi:hypothetical protein
MKNRVINYKSHAEHGTFEKEIIGDVFQTLGGNEEIDVKEELKWSSWLSLLLCYT